MCPMTRRNLLSHALGAGSGVLGMCPENPRSIRNLPWSANPVAERQIAVAYSLWHYPPQFGEFWSNDWGTPELGRYISNDRRVIRQHAQWLVAAGVDFILVDCSNDLGSDLRTKTGYPYQKFEEVTLLALFEEFASLSAAPRIAIMIGNPTEPDALFNGQLTRKCDEIDAVFVRDSRFSRLLYYYLEKPLLVVYGPTPALYTDSLPPWTDQRFTVRFMTCFVTQQPKILGAYRESKLGYWSWEDRGIPSFPIVAGTPEIMTVVAAWRSSKPEHIAACPRHDGLTYKAGWAAARRIGPRFVLAGTFNEWKKGEQPSAEVSKDLEPSKEFGFTYMDILKEEGAFFKRGT